MIKSGEKGDASLLRPTIMAAVPLILDRIYKGINRNIQVSSYLTSFTSCNLKKIEHFLQEKGYFSQKLVEYCIAYKMKWFSRGFDTPMMNAIIFSKMKSVVGGRLRVLLSGGAPLADDAHAFIRTCLSITLLQGKLSACHFPTNVKE